MLIFYTIRTPIKFYRFTSDLHKRIKKNNAPTLPQPEKEHEFPRNYLIKPSISGTKKDEQNNVTHYIETYQLSAAKLASMYTSLSPVPHASL